MKKTNKKQSKNSKHTSKKSKKVNSIYDICEKKHCSKELKLEKQLVKINNIKIKKLKCNYDRDLNDKFDKFNQVQIKYDFNPLHFPYNKITTSPCIEYKDKLLNAQYEPDFPMYKCRNKYCKYKQNSNK